MSGETKRTKHTPGEWAAVPTEECWEVRGSDGVIARIPDGSGTALQEEVRARLIAAAPDLLDALRRLLDAAEVELPNEAARRCYDEFDLARAAIAKAEGRS